MDVKGNSPPQEPSTELFPIQSKEARLNPVCGVGVCPRIAALSFEAEDYRN